VRQRLDGASDDDIEKDRAAFLENRPLGKHDRDEAWALAHHKTRAQHAGTSE
jgi:hypothetical protein